MLVCSAAYADSLAAGTVKSIGEDKQEFVLTDGKDDWTFGFADNVMISRGGEDKQGELKVGDMVHLHYDKGVLKNTAKFILIKEGEAKDWTLAHGTFKGYNAADKQITFTGDDDKEFTYAMTPDAKVRLNNQESNIGELKADDHVLAVLTASGDQPMVKCLHADR